ncbi:sulfur carrier protein ThiS [Zhongshania aliphaticivorans]|uniref:sulfur carrier protein ThiS n=1 Tax=Zhongshania aliphaticivorans TaxID=1470434 RepID=UPI0012E52C56|nr:sulfur carrier protein ThiS [Zhongshania aliphaticivorans]CAA0091022.1 Sulfur carrier protein ThiS [Zhongshania aliphaticivorans]
MTGLIITVSVNNESKDCASDQPLARLLTVWGFDAEKVAIAVNEDFVPRSQYEHYCLEDGDKVDVLAPVQGG